MRTWCSQWIVFARHRIRDPVIPRQQRAAAIEHTRSWKRRDRFRNGLEGRISQLKRTGLRRTRSPTLAGAQTWVGSITLAHNLQRMALLTRPTTATGNPKRHPAIRRRGVRRLSRFSGGSRPRPPLYVGGVEPPGVGTRGVVAAGISTERCGQVELRPPSGGETRLLAWADTTRIRPSVTPTSSTPGSRGTDRLCRS
jgi:hypothetical protein